MVRHQAFLGLGGNIGDPADSMRHALQLVDGDSGTSVKRVSAVYRTPPWGKIDQPDFLNAVTEIQTDRSAKQLLQLCLDVEHRLKRIRNERWGPRLIDIDILWFDGQTIEEEGLHIPHPRMLDRAFVLVPLAEIAPDLMLEGQTASARAMAINRAGIDVEIAGHFWWKPVGS